MNLSLYSAATGMDAQQLNLNTIANNLANVNTPGFKRSTIEFQDLLYQKPKAAGADSGGGNLVATGIEVGNGSRVAATSKVFTQGQLTNSGERLDFALQGDGFFEVQRPDGTIGYTRAGSFKLSAAGQVVTTDGLPVLSGFPPARPASRSRKMAKSPTRPPTAARPSASRSPVSPTRPAWRASVAISSPRPPRAVLPKRGNPASRATPTSCRATSKPPTSTSWRKW